MSRKISLVVAPDFELLELSGPLCAFSMAHDKFAAPYEVNVVSTMGGNVISGAGVGVQTQPIRSVTHGDTIMVVGGRSAHCARHHAATSTALKTLAPSMRRLASVCTGAFYLAEAGLLDYRRVTTHWRYAPILQSRFPALSVEADRIFIHDAGVWTSAGISAGIDLALAIIEEDFGTALAKSVAHELVVYHRRPGGQSQFSAILDLAPTSDRVRHALSFARDHLHENLSVDSLADVACLSSRQFSRLFLRETGQTPARAIERLRADAARPRLEAGGESMAIIAKDTGFGDVERMRRTFIKLFGLSPQAIRRSALRYGQ